MRIKQAQLLLLLHEKMARKELLKSGSVWLKSLSGSLFPKQRAFVYDDGDAIAALCTRRAGKTHGSAVKLILRANDNPNSTALYLALTRKAAKNLLWPKLKEIKSKYKVPLKFNEADLIAELPNESKIMLYGADQANLAERLRGDAYCVVVIDEAASFRDLSYLIEDVLEPALLDYQGQLCMIGTPGTVLNGSFYDATTSDNSGFNVHRWSLLDNPYLAHAKQWIERLLIRRNWDETNPTYQREYCGKWIKDVDALVYKFDVEVNSFDELPKDVHDWQHIIGLDVGYEDPAAWSVIAFSEQLGKAYLIHNEAHGQWIPEQWAKLTQELIAKYNPIDVRMDAGALGKPIMMEMQRRWGIPVNAAEKVEKMANIELLNGDFKTNKFYVSKECKELIHQMSILTKNDKGTGEDQGLPNDRCIAKGTLITTKKGQIPIEDVEPGMYVLTRKGYKMVLKKYENGYKNCRKIADDRGNVLFVTGNHPIMTPSGWKNAEDITIGESILCLKQIKFNTTDTTGTENYQNIDTMQGVFQKTTSHIVNSYTGMYGKLRSERYQKATSFITRTTTRLITNSKTLNVLPRKRIANITQKQYLKKERKKLESTFTKTGIKLRNGILAKRGLNGTKSITKTQWAKTEKRLMRNALYVDKSIRQRKKERKQNGFVHQNALQKRDETQASTILNSHVNGAEKRSKEISTKKQNIVVAHVTQNTQTTGDIEVYDLEIELQHEYFSNNILTKNCDSMLYGWRHCYHFLHQESEAAPKYGTEEWFKQEEQRMIQYAIEQDTKALDEDSWLQELE